MSDDKYRKCHLAKGANGRFVWLPIKFAKVYRTVKLNDDPGEYWVRTVYAKVKTLAELKSKKEELFIPEPGSQEAKP